MIPVKLKCDYHRINRTRRSRGYSFEYFISQAFNNRRDWAAKRLGGTSVGLPDIIATNTEQGTVLSIECKSGDTDTHYIPADQLDRCKDIIDRFLSFYPNRYIVLAFKFKANKHKKRKLHYYFLVLEKLEYSANLKGIKFSWKDTDKLIPSFIKVPDLENKFEYKLKTESPTISFMILGSE